MNSKLITADEAARLVRDGDTVVVGGFVGSGHPEALTSSLEARFLSENQPRDLNLVFVAGQGDAKTRGLNHFGNKGMVRRAIGGHWGLAPRLGKLAMDNEIEAYNLPQGVISHMFRDISAAKPCTITHVGLKTYVDPRIEGGKVNSRTTEDIVSVMEIDGGEYLKYKHFNIDVCLIRGTTADEFGNISMEQEVATLEALSQAMATKKRGGIVICQVMRLARNQGINHLFVEIPGIFIDYIVLVDMVKTPELHMQTFAEQYCPYYSGQVAYPEDSLFNPMAMNIRKIIARRGLLELLPLGHSVVNLGIGMPEGVANVAKEEGVRDRMVLTVESGPIGGLPASGLSFGASYSPICTLDQPYQFDFYDGGGLDIAFLGAGEVDCSGNVNVSRFGPKFAGCGGFINITQNSRRVVFCNTFTSGGLVVEARDGALKIVTEGKIRKFVSKVEQITFSADYAVQKGTPVTYITERCVFTLDKTGFRLTEVAPGIDVQTQILDLMDFKPIVPDRVAIMDPRIFRDGLMNLE
ncbi:MAG: acyl CoA:acetate/3-ketoacid CoA transferase [Candidatus Wallbacteria bacterium HGW-Wallbacteria-1]|uniref:Acyl CoA:acetate/3-ketoacid CoA transferase n=1 Tax=Candidatus Wallbacteria bacterium HGW-Wallbacteria-1 TaxID=2013854 RepID=A0A2N1PL75_9BACT|nr:MAG: acyl CoA:acetate/3-ketoacid CoA transferase [Candidatus Wallbacteria bacterium HGW-Wallbacteria-1]